MRVFYWSSSRQLFAAARGGVMLPNGMLVSDWPIALSEWMVRDLLGSGFVEVSVSTAVAMGWPA